MYEKLILARDIYALLPLVGAVGKKNHLAESKLFAYMGFCVILAFLASVLFLIKELVVPSEVRIPLDKQA